MQKVISTPEGQKLKNLIDNLIINKDSIISVKDSIIEINNRYLNLDRSQLPRPEMNELKFNLQFLKKSILQYSKTIIKNKKLCEILNDLIKLYIELDVYIEDKILEKIQIHIQGCEKDTHDLLFVELLVRQNRSQMLEVFKDGKYFAEYKKAVGPYKDIKIVANKTSKIVYEKWSKISNFKNYEYRDDGVIFRGKYIQEGDVILSNVNIWGNGVYTAVANEKDCAYHMGVFCIIRDNDKRIPVVIEAYEKGARPVPLKIFLSKRFCSYCEIYRMKDIEKKQMHNLGKVALEMCREVKGYNFDTEDVDREYLACTMVPTALYERAGIDPIKSKSSYFNDPKIKRNLEAIGQDYSKFFVLADYAQDKRMKCVGVIDNDEFIRNITSEMLERRFKTMFLERQVVCSKLPLEYQINYWGIGQLRNKTMVGKVITLIFGFDSVSLPKGDDRTLAVVEVLMHSVGRDIKRNLKVFKSIINYSGPLFTNDLETKVKYYRTQGLLVCSENAKECAAIPGRF